eukprot:1004835_1
MKYFIISIINNVSSSYSKSIKYDGNIFFKNTFNCPDKEAESNDGSDIKGIGDEWYTNLRLKKHLLGVDVIPAKLCKLPSVVSSMVNRDPSKIPYIPDSTRNPYAPNPRESIQIFVLLYRNRVQWYNTIIFSHQSTPIPITSVNDGLPLQDYQRCSTTSQIEYMDNMTKEFFVDNFQKYFGEPDANIISTPDTIESIHENNDENISIEIDNEITTEETEDIDINIDDTIIINVCMFLFCNNEVPD